jgi:hypothetical protein
LNKFLEFFLRCALLVRFVSTLFVVSFGFEYACPDFPLCFGQIFPAVNGPILLQLILRFSAFLCAVAAVWHLFHRRQFPSRLHWLIPVFCILQLAVLAFTAGTSLVWIDSLFATFALAALLVHERTVVRVAEGMLLLGGMGWLAAQTYVVSLPFMPRCHWLGPCVFPSDVPSLLHVLVSATPLVSLAIVAGCLYFDRRLVLRVLALALFVLPLADHISFTTNAIQIPLLAKMLAASLCLIIVFDLKSMVKETPAQ